MRPEARDTSTGASERRPDVSPRVAVVQAQARRALVMSFLFAIAAAVFIPMPHRTGAWLPLHLFLVGSLLLAISGATRLFAVTWSAGTPATGAAVAVQRWSLAIGATGLAIGRELGLAVPFLAASGLCVTAGLVLLGYLLVVDVRHGRVHRFHPALHFYLTALALGVAGTGLGAAMVTGSEGLRDAHVIVNLLGLVGLVIAGTLPFFVATQARMKMSSRATPRRMHRALGWLVAGVVLAAGASLLGHPAVTGAGLIAYAAGLLYLVTLLPVPRGKQHRWAGPRLAQLGLGVAWWAGASGVAGARALQGGGAFPERLVVVLVIGGFVQILVASLAYLAPVLRGGGHLRLTAGFTVTRSWIALGGANLAGVAWTLHQGTLAIAALMIVAVDVAVRGVWMVVQPPPLERADESGAHTHSARHPGGMDGDAGDRSPVGAGHV